MDAEQELAATKIAAAKRGNQARQEMNEKKEAAAKIGAVKRGQAARRERQEQEQAATVMQKNARGARGRSLAPGGGQRYYTPKEVAMHNRADDLWVSMFEGVHDLTKLVASQPGSLVQPIIEAAGTDISHWFDEVTKEVKTYIDPVTELEVPFCPMGEFLHCPPVGPVPDWSSNFKKPWWKDKTTKIGDLTRKTRKIRLFNMLSKQETVIEVCMEETLAEIQSRYLNFNQHSGSYVWKRSDDKTLARVLDMNATLAGNDIPDEDLQFDLLNMDPDDHIPTIHLYFSDDLTVA